MENKTKFIKNFRIRKKKLVTIILILLFIAFIALGFAYIDNKNIDFEYFNVDSQFNAGDDIKIIHLSDLHFPKISVDIDKLLKKLTDEQPDIIAITGDLIDGNATFESCGVAKFIDDIKNLAPIFYVYGNHELRNTDNKDKLTAHLTSMKVNILKNESINVKVKNTDITIIGLQDNANYDSKVLNTNVEAEKNFKILLAHRPEKWENYTSKDNNIVPDLILTGHMHGGQFRMFGQGLYAPNQGFFPKYDGGIYKTDDIKSTMIVSRGIGSSIIPIRFNNRPNVPIITLKA